MSLEKDFVVLRQETDPFAVSCVSLAIFPVYSSRMTIFFSFLHIFFLRIIMVLLLLCVVLSKDVLLKNVFLV